MAQLDTLDIIVLVVLFVGTIAYFTKGTYWAVAEDPSQAALAHGNGAKTGMSRNLLEKMEESGKNCVVLYGSQTGTAEDYASRLAKEGASRFGLKTMVADLDDYDYDNLNTFPKDKVAFFVLATYGEGEPTDNAVEFYEFISAEDPSFGEGGSDDGKPLGNLNFVAFGLGNNTYEHYNSMVRNVNKALEKLGATRIGDAGEGDDGAGTMEEDFLEWKEPMWSALQESMGLEEHEAVYEPTFDVAEKSEMDTKDKVVYLGEPNKSHLEGRSKGPYNAHNPYIAPIANSKELFSAKDRNCLHMDINIADSGMSYSTGDHIAVWPTNPGKEVDRFLKMMGLDKKQNTVISVKGLDSTAKVPFPSPTTYDSVARYNLEICAPMSRQLVATLAQFAPNDQVKEEVSKLGSDKEYFHEKVSNRNLNFAQFLEVSADGQAWTNIPFSLCIEALNKLQPRYYSISSSSMANKGRVAITAVVSSEEKDGAPFIVKGVTTNYLLALKEKQHGASNPDPNGLNYNLEGPRNRYDGIHVPVHIRHSNFKLPSDPSKPVVMVGPGTGVAPFRAFVQERAEQAKQGKDVGKTLLFYGCRKESEDFLYKDEWKEYKNALGDKFEMYTAFSRDGPDKVYVQHKIKEKAKEVNELLQKKGFFYVCGDAANMARDVSKLLVKIIAEQRDMSDQKAEETVKSMRASNQYQEDVWS